MNNTESIKYLYPHEKTALFRALETDQSAHCLRNRAIFYLAEYCGMRASEVGQTF
jgi:integrase